MQCKNLWLTSHNIYLLTHDFSDLHLTLYSDSVTWSKPEPELGLRLGLCSIPCSLQVLDLGSWTRDPAQNKSILILQVKYINPAGFRFKIVKFDGLLTTLQSMIWH